MAGSDAYVERGERTASASVIERRAFGRLRSLMVEPDAVYLWTDSETGRRWLTDRYVLLDVTGNPVAESAQDGEHKLQAGRGLMPAHRHVAPDTGGLLSAIQREESDWLPVERTQWAIADSQAKIMLVWAGNGPQRFPLGINEGVWAAFAAAYEDGKTHVGFEKDPARPGRPFRVRMTVKDADPVTVAYVMGAHLPEGEMPAAQLVVSRQ